jgi:predicted nucleotidyltransferase
MKESIKEILKELKGKISEKYDINEMRLFGSSARGDRRADSDIDVFINLKMVNRQIEEDLFDIAYDLELKHDCLIDIIVFSDDIINDHHSTSSIYRKVIEEDAVI